MSDQVTIEQYQNYQQQQLQQENQEYDNPNQLQQANQQQQQQNYKQVLIKLSDIQPENQCTIISISNAAIQQIADIPNLFQTQKYSKIAGIIKKQLDQKLGQGWYVIVGKNFGTFVTHQQGSFMHYTFDDLHICVFKSR